MQKVGDKEQKELTVACLRSASQLYAEMCAASGAPIRFYIGTCYGGFLEPMLDLVEQIEGSGVLTEVMVTEKASSAAALLAAGCSEGFRYASPDAKFMIHSIRLFFDTSIAQIGPGGTLPASEWLKCLKLNARLARFLKRRTKLPHARIKQILRYNGHAIFNAQSAQDAGIVDHLVLVLAPH